MDEYFYSEMNREINWFCKIMSGGTLLIQSFLLGNGHFKHEPSMLLSSTYKISDNLELHKKNNKIDNPSHISPNLSILFVGDVMVARGVAQRNHNQWNRPLEPVLAILKKNTLVIGNLESPLTTQPFRGGRSSVGHGVEPYDLRANPAVVAALRPFTFLNLKNNHALDGGELGLEQTRQTLSKAGIVPLEGFYKTTLGTQHITLFSWMDLGRPLPLEEIKHFARGDALLIAYLHWGSEYAGITTRQRELAQQMVNAGVDLIVGTGPHVVQPLEYISGVPVAYSLGNFLFDQHLPSTRVGLMLRASWINKKWYLERIPTRIQAGQVKLKTSS